MGISLKKKSPAKGTNMYDPQMAHYFAVLCDRSYKEHTLEVGNIQVTVLADAVRTVIIFRGTEVFDLRDLKTDISFKVKEESMRVS